MVDPSSVGKLLVGVFSLCTTAVILNVGCYRQIRLIPHPPMPPAFRPLRLYHGRRGEMRDEYLAWRRLRCAVGWWSFDRRKPTFDVVDSNGRRGAARA